MTVLLEAWQDWECPNCHHSDRTVPMPANVITMEPPRWVSAAAHAHAARPC